MNYEKVFIVMSALFLGALGTGMDFTFNQLLYKSHPILTWFGVWALVFYIFAIHFVLKYTGLICRKRRKKKDAKL